MHLDRRIDSAHGLMDFERRPNGALRIVGVCDRCAKHGHHAVANMLVDGPAERLHDIVDDTEETVQHRVDFLRIGPGGEMGEAGDVGEEHGHLAPFALHRTRSADRCCLRRRSVLAGSRRVQLGDCCQKFPAMSELGDPKLLEVFVAQELERFRVDGIVV